MIESVMGRFASVLSDIAQELFSLRTILVFVITLTAAALINRFLTLLIPKVADYITRHTDMAESTDRLMRLRRLETYLSIGTALFRTIIIFAALFLAWRVSNPTDAPLALVGASALFIVLAGATVGPILRDLTYGTVMHLEGWYNVGDHVSVEPFENTVSGVVEQVTLRSTKIRHLSGEIIWVHNQHIQAVRIIPRGFRTLAVDTFVSDLERGRETIERALSMLPKGPTMIIRPPKIAETEQLSDDLWRITVIGQTAPGREWLIEDFAVRAIKDTDARAGENAAIIHGPIVRYTDAAAERRYRRAVRIK